MAAGVTQGARRRPAPEAAPRAAPPPHFSLLVCWLQVRLPFAATPGPSPRRPVLFPFAF